MKGAFIPVAHAGAWRVGGKKGSGSLETRG